MIREPIWLDTYRGHPIESFVQGWGMLAGFLVGLDPKEALAALIIISVKGMMRHDARTAWLIDGGYHLEHHRNPSVNI
jgi:hypothetical protein